MKKIIEVKGLKKSFGRGSKRIEAVKDLSFDVYENEVFGFLGPNGAGKTTSLRMITGLLQPDAGEVIIKGYNRNTNDKSLRKIIGMIPQSPTFYDDLTVKENLFFIAKLYDMPNHLAKKRIESLTLEIGLDDKFNSLARNLSGGQKRRLNLILGLVHDPEIIICDEPTPGLDPQSRVTVWKFIKSLPDAGKTVILSTHYMEEADRLSNRVAIIDYGKLLILDTPSKLKASVGAGDLAEIQLTESQGKISGIDLARQLKTFDPEIPIQKSTYDDSFLTIQGLNLIPKLSQILAFIERQDFSVHNLQIRGTTLEDVFIDLTGRQLRS
ncbi:MAG: ABC transporter ATP-binding protein [Candidatus Hodarchaeales archaeon]|jgi:ABC-2 type transport system ATP-binding protein